MAYADLTTEQKASVQALLQLVRPLTAEHIRTLEKMQAATAYYGGNVETILGELQNGDVIPNESGLAGAQSVTKSELVTQIGFFINASSNASVPNAEGSYNTAFHRALAAKLAGPDNLIVA